MPPALNLKKPGGAEHGMKKATLCIVYFGKIMAVIQRSLEARLKQVFLDLGIDLVIKKRYSSLSKDSFNHERGQVKSHKVFAQLDDICKGIARFKVGLVAVDLYSSTRPELNFIFGEAFLGGDKCIVSVFRLDPEFYGMRKNPSLFKDRVLKEVLHEMGHMLNLRHCQHELCVMHFSNEVYDTDLKETRYCDRCRSFVRNLLDA